MEERVQHRDTWDDGRECVFAARELVTQAASSIGIYARGAIALLGATGEGTAGAERVRRYQVAVKNVGRKDRRYFRETLLPVIVEQTADALYIIINEAPEAELPLPAGA